MGEGNGKYDGCCPANGNPDEPKKPALDGSDKVIGAYSSFGKPGKFAITDKKKTLYLEFSVFVQKRKIIKKKNPDKVIQILKP